MKEFFSSLLILMIAVMPLVLLMLFVQLFFEMEHISTEDTVYYYEQVPLSGKTQVTIPEEYGVPEECFVQMAVSRSPKGVGCAEVLVVKTDK